MLPYLFGMYGIPLLYGLALRYTRFRDLTGSAEKQAGRLQASIVACEDTGGSVRKGKEVPRRISLGEKLLEETNNSIQASVQSMLSLGGYMILFNLLNLIPHILLGRSLPLFSPLFEITGGLRQLWDFAPGKGLPLWYTLLPLYSLLALSFGGFSCIAQTYSCISGSDLSIRDYILHKIVLTAVTGFFYLCWFLFLPGSFLR